MLKTLIKLHGKFVDSHTKQQNALHRSIADISKLKKDAEVDREIKLMEAKTEMIEKRIKVVSSEIIKPVCGAVMASRAPTKPDPKNFLKELREAVSQELAKEFKKNLKAEKDAEQAAAEEFCTVQL